MLSLQYIKVAYMYRYIFSQAFIKIAITYAMASTKKNKHVRLGCKINISFPYYCSSVQQLGFNLLREEQGKLTPSNTLFPSIQFVRLVANNIHNRMSEKHQNTQCVSALNALTSCQLILWKQWLIITKGQRRTDCLCKPCHNSQRQ